MPKAIGPTFSEELRVAGLAGLPFSWAPDGSFTFDPRMTPEQIAAVRAVLAAHDPTKTLQPPVKLAPLLATVEADGATPGPVKALLAALVARVP